MLLLLRLMFWFFANAAFKSVFQFASGSVFINPTGGNLPTNPTPMKLGTLQDASAEFSCTLKELRGELQFPDDVAPGDKKITWKATLGKMEIALFNQVFFSDSYDTTGQLYQADSEIHAIPTSGIDSVLTFTAVAVNSLYGTAEYAFASHTGANPAIGQRIVIAGFATGGNNVTGVILDVSGTTTGTIALALTTQVNETHAGTGTIAHAGTVTVTNSATFDTDEGVVYASGPNVGAPLLRVPSGPATGEYSVSAGVYSFNSADVGLNVAISYAYTSTIGSTLTINSKPMGYGATFELFFYWKYQGQSGLWLSTCRASKLGTPTKRDNYLIIDIEGEAYASPTGVVGKWFQQPA